MRTLRTLMLSTGTALVSLGVMSSTQIPTNRVITRISTYGSIALVKFAPEYANQDGCSGPADVAVIDWTSNADNKVMYAAALAALHSGAKVGLGTDGCSGSYNNYPLLYRIDIEP